MKQVLTVLLALFAALLLATTAAAQSRTIPKEAVRGKMTHLTENIVSVNGQRMRLAPGALIYAQNNLIIVPTQLPRDSLVEYTTDRSGDLFKVWILTPQEAARPNPHSTGGIWPADEPRGTPIQQVLPKSSPSGSSQPSQQSSQPSQQ